MTVPVPGAGAVAGLKLVFGALDGGVSGPFTHPVTGRAVSFGGLILQKQGRAAGWFHFVPAAATGQSAMAGAIDVTLR